MSRRASASAPRVVLGMILALAACGEPVEPAESGLELVGTLPAHANRGWPLRDAVRVRLIGEEGEPQAGATVAWLVTAGGGAIVPAAATTDEDGIASAVWSLGAATGANEVTVSSPGEESLVLQVAGNAFWVEQLASSAFLGCGLVEGEIWCWGKDAWTSTGYVSIHPTSTGWTNAAPGLVSGPANFTAIAASGGTVCGLDDAGAVLCASESAPALAPLAGLPAMSSIVGAAWGAGDFCGLTSAGSVAWCWSGTSAPAPVPGSPAFTQLDIDGAPGGGGPYAGFLACGLRADATAACWGTGSLGDASGGGSDTPVSVAGAHEFIEVAVSEIAACGRKLNGEVWCWGSNDRGQLGIEGPDAPEPVLSATGVDRIAASQDLVLALKDGTVIRWGGGVLDPSSPVASLAGLDVVDFSANSMECVSLTDGQVYCYDEMWDRTSEWATERYSPVHPVVVP